MELKQGFKQTEVGMIPNDWEVKSLYEVADINQNGSKKIPDEFIYVDLESVTKGRLVKKNLINKINAPSRAQRIVIPLDILFQTVRPYQKNNLLFKESGEYIASTGYAVLRSKVEPGYLYAQIHTDKFVNTVIDFCTGTSYPAINPVVLGAIKLPIPPTKAEQIAIAEALSNIDELISQTEKLIEKKKAIKQGVMQELLKRKEGWVTKRISEVCWFQEGPGVRKHQFTQSGVKLLNGTNIQEGKLDLENTDKFISEDEAFGWYSHFLVDENDILIACSGVSIDKFHEKVTVAKVFHLPLCMNTSTMRFKVKKGYLDQGYFIQFLKSKRFKEQISGKATGSAQLNFGPSHVTMVEIDLPGIEIQNKIGQVLSDMEMEIGNFEIKLKKLSFQKQGMMQALLTGKIRLV
jgi:type I restriction enzyme S subunit